MATWFRGWIWTHVKRWCKIRPLKAPTMHLNSVITVTMKLEHNHFTFVCKHWHKQRNRARGNVIGDDKIKMKRGMKTRDRVICEQRGEREGNKYKRKRMSTHSHTPCHERFFYKWARSSHEVRETELWLGAWVSTTVSNHQSRLCVWGHMGGMGEKDFRVAFIVVREGPKCQEKHYKTTLKWCTQVTAQSILIRKVTKCRRKYLDYKIYKKAILTGINGILKRGETRFV